MTLQDQSSLHDSIISDDELRRSETRRLRAVQLHEEGHFPSESEALKYLNHLADVAAGKPAVPTFKAALANIRLRILNARAALEEYRTAESEQAAARALTARLSRLDELIAYEEGRIADLGSEGAAVANYIERVVEPRVQLFAAVDWAKSFLGERELVRFVSERVLPELRKRRSEIVTQIESAQAAREA